MPENREKVGNFVKIPRGIIGTVEDVSEKCGAEDDKGVNPKRQEVRGQNVHRRTPSSGADMVAELLLDPETADQMIGHLREIYNARILPKYGSRRANVWYWFQILQQVLWANVAKLRYLEDWREGLRRRGR